MRYALTLILAALLAIVVATPAAADRGPTQVEAAKIAAVLTAAGFKSWNKVQYDEDGPKWKVDDARAINGKTYDLELSPNDYQIFKKSSD